MALFTEKSEGQYAQPHMPQPAKGDGPWGEAIAYWLNVRHWRQADLVRATKGGLSKNTVSIAFNGLDVNTETLRIIAKALNAPLDEVLVSPDRKSANETRKQMVIEIAERVLRDVESTRSVGQMPSADLDRAVEKFDEAITNEERRRARPIQRLSGHKKLRRK